MSAGDTVEIPKDLLRRVMAEVEELRAAVAEAQDEATQARTDAETATAERDAARTATAEAQRTRDAAASAAADRDRLQRELDALRRAHDDLRAEHADLLRTHPLPPTRRPAATSGAPNATAEPAETLARVFVAWCRRGSPLVSRSYLFAAFLREAAGQPVEVRTVYRDRSQATPTFTDRPAAGTEHWLVTLGNLHALVPQPATPRAFTETAAAFAGDVPPDRLGAITPAIPDGLEAPFGIASRGTLA